VKLLTVAIPFRNCASVLSFSVRSVFAQHFHDWELLLVDDGSTDRSLEVVSGIRDPRVKVISDGRCLGLAARLNQIADLARTPLLARMDADDLMHPARLIKQVERMERSPDLCILATGAYSVNEQYEVQGIRKVKVQNASELFIRNLIVHPSLVGRTSWWRNNRYDVRLLRSQDKELWLRSFSRLKYDVIPEPLVFYQENVRDSYRKFCTYYPLERDMVFKYGPTLVGNPQTAMLLAYFKIKYAAYFCCNAFGAGRFLFDSRFDEMTDAERFSAQEAADEVFQTRVPGLNDF